MNNLAVVALVNTCVTSRQTVTFESGPRRPGRPGGRRRRARGPAPSRRVSSASPGPATVDGHGASDHESRPRPLRRGDGAPATPAAEDCQSRLPASARRPPTASLRRAESNLVTRRGRGQPEGRLPGPGPGQPRPGQHRVQVESGPGRRRPAAKTQLLFLWVAMFSHDEFFFSSSFHDCWSHF